MTPGETLPPLPTHRTPLFRRGSSGGCGKTIHPGEDFPMRFTARPRMGGRRAVWRLCRGSSRRDRLLPTPYRSFIALLPPTLRSRGQACTASRVQGLRRTLTTTRARDETTRAPQRQFRVQAARSIWRSHQAALSGRNGTPQLLASDGSSSRVPDHNCIMITAKRRPAPRSRAARGPPATS